MTTNQITLRAAGTTNPNDLCMAIVGHLEAGNVVLVDALGEKANYRALKSVIGARSEAKKKGLDVKYDVIKTDVVEVNAELPTMTTAFRWILSATGKQN